MESSGDNLLTVRNLVVRYEASLAGSHALTAVRDVSLEIRPGEVFALVGESGSGKTSLAHSILGLTPISAGEILFRDKNLATASPAEWKEVRKSIQMVFQDPLASLSPRRNVLQALREPLDHFRVGRPSDRREQAVAALETVGLDPDMGERYPHELSGGQRQRVALARALVSEPRLIIADEPVSSLDVSVQAKVIRLMLELRDRMGIALLFVSHDLAVVKQLADTVAVMYLGKLVESAPAARLFSHPAHPYTRSLLSAVPVPDPRRAAPAVLAGEPPSPLTPPPGCVFHKRCSETFEPCASVEPGECRVDATDSRMQDQGQGDHRVRCHLWSPEKSTT